jgi:hypothetical protein
MVLVAARLLLKTFTDMYEKQTSVDSYYNQ